MPSFFSILLSYLSNPITWIMLVFGAIVGSFLNVCIIRLPKNTFFTRLRSACPFCEITIPFWLNIPIFSWFILRGRTACCNQRLSLQYPIVEAFSALIFAFLYWRFPFVVDYQKHFELHPQEFIRFVHMAVFSCLLVVMAVIDFYHQIIPNILSIPMVLISPLVAALHPELTLIDSTIGIFAGGGGLYLVAWLYYLLRKEIGLGMGDVKLLAAIGGWLGYQALLPTVFIGSIIGATVGILVIVITKEMSLKSKIPFGPFLAVGALIDFVYRAKIIMFLFDL